MNKLTRRTIGVLDWINSHWNSRRAFVSLLFVFPTAVIFTSALMGVGRAYGVSSPAEIVPLELWLEVIAPESGFESLAHAILSFGMVVPVLAVVDLAGRFAYAHLLWVPVGVWRAAGQFVLVLPLAVVLFNALWTLGEAYTRAIEPGSRGDLDG